VWDAALQGVVHGNPRSVVDELGALDLRLRRSRVVDAAVPE
jgi:hypothetical protein